MIKSINGKAKVFFGIDKNTKKRIYLNKPTFDCGWYWGFGYLGNNNLHYHLDSYQTKEHSFKLEDGSYKHISEKRNINMVDALLTDYDLSDKIKDNIWSFCELVLTAYTLIQTAKCLECGGSYITTNLCQDTIINKVEVTRINDVVLPAIFNKISELIES